MGYVAKPEDGVAWVTGASSGIGKGLAQALAREGFTVIATARGQDKLAALAAEDFGKGSIVAMPGDVTDAADLHRIVETIDRDYARLALAVFNAGVYLPVHGNGLDTTDFQKSFDVNLNGVVNGLVPAVASMARNGKGQIAIVSSVTGFGGLPTSAAYGATKAALTNLAESLKFDLDKMNIRLQIVHPGFVDTPATEKNEFAMPALMQVEDAVARLVAGLKSDRFEIIFPRRFTFVLKCLRLLPYPAYFWAINRATGWRNRPLD
ncbi:SDR family NAD(P)-dependent oxidoreductase [Pararhizobium haloflavum]|uniref:SDR family NAD(P)-dependent oxidoreductase n=1 Tax=Pararhizobium haloflavum TaxID=2037914 RepID=UPI001FE1BC93|nr:SDR family NAD(P)-dependent oxidoreductase [Pararhizobium haloflavum]